MREGASPGELEEDDPCPSLWIVVPLRNEAVGIRPTLASLAAQRDRSFTLVLVDNGSTDGSLDVIQRALATSPIRQWSLIQESQKGTGLRRILAFASQLRLALLTWQGPTRIVSLIPAGFPLFAQDLPLARNSRGQD